MSNAPYTFAPVTEKQVLQLVLENPLAWIVSGGVEDHRSTLLPLRPLADKNGKIHTLVGHFARSNEQVAALQATPRALILMRGPHGYVSPSWIHDKTWGPTWNYASVQFVVDLAFFEEPYEIEAHLRDLVDSNEEGRPGAWNIEQMGPRFHSLAKHVIGFRATVREERAKFKLGQDERDVVYRDIAHALHAAGATDLLTWMQQLNPERAL